VAHRPQTANQKRRAARSQFLTPLVAKQDYRCYWCDEKIVRISNLHDREQRSSVVKIIAHQRELGRVVYRAENGKVYHARVATLDHVCPLGKGGSNSQNNVVAACYECNQTRNRVVQFGAGGRKDAS